MGIPRRISGGPGVIAVLVLLCGCGGGSSGSITTDVGTYAVAGVEAGQMDVTACHGTDCTVNRDGVYFAKREILLTLEPQGTATGVDQVTNSAFAQACAGGGLFVSDGTNGFGCESVNVAEDGGIAVVFSDDNVCRNCPDDGFEGPLVLHAPGNEPLTLD